MENKKIIASFIDSLPAESVTELTSSVLLSAGGSTYATANKGNCDNTGDCDGSVNKGNCTNTQSCNFSSNQGLEGCTNPGLVPPGNTGNCASSITAC